MIDQHAQAGAGDDEQDHVGGHQPEVVFAAAQVQERKEKGGDENQAQEAEQRGLCPEKPPEPEQETDQAHSEHLLPDLNREILEPDERPAVVAGIGAPLRAADLGREARETDGAAVGCLREGLRRVREIEIRQERAPRIGRHREAEEAAIPERRPSLPGEPEDRGKEDHGHGVIAEGEAVGDEQEDAPAAAGEA